MNKITFKNIVFLGLLLICGMTFASVPLYTNIIRVYSDSPNFDIQLSSNPSTGYTYQVQWDKNSIELISGKPEYIPPNTTALGASGLNTWHFHTKTFNRPHSTEIKFIYGQHWKGGKKDSPIIYHVNIN